VGRPRTIRPVWCAHALVLAALGTGLGAIVAAGCGRRAKPPSETAPHATAPPPAPTGPIHAPIPRRPPAPTLVAGETYVYRGDVAEKQTVEAARAAGLLDVDLTDGWAPFIFQDSSGADADDARPNAYRATFVALANDRVDPEGRNPRRGDHNYLEVFGIPPTLSVLAARIEEDLKPARRACFDGLDLEPLRRFTGEVGYLDRERAKRAYLEAVRDGDWLRKQRSTSDPSKGSEPPANGGGAIDGALLQALREDPKRRGRVDRYLRGQARLRAVRAAQAYLACDRLLSFNREPSEGSRTLPRGTPLGEPSSVHATDARTRFTDGMFDLPTHEALADWERKNDIFGWGFLGGETLANMLRPPLDLHFDTFKRILAERVADAAGIVEDGSTARARNPPTYRDAAGTAQPVPNLIQQHVDALLASLHVATPEDMVAFLRSLAATAGLDVLHVAFHAPPLPPYYGAAAPAIDAGGAAASSTVAAGELDLSVEIDRGDIWYDFPYDGRGRPIEQRRDHYPHLTLFVHWNDQKIPLCRWRTTIGSWRSEVHPDGRVYMKYKNSDVGARVWKNIVAGPVWIPPDGTPARDLLTHKVLDPHVGPVTVVNSDVMGPGFQSAYGLVLAIHIDPKRGGFDNQIRTHGSVDYTSIARRFSHGCHRLVNNRAVRLFDFVLRHHTFRRIGDVPLRVRRKFSVDDKQYAYKLDTRGYYYELAHPVPVDVSEGRIMGAVKKPILSYMRKPGVDYSAPASGDANASIATPRAGVEPAGAEPPENAGAEPEPPGAGDNAHELGP